MFLENSQLVLLFVCLFVFVFVFVFYQPPGCGIIIFFMQILSCKREKKNIVRSKLDFINAFTFYLYMSTCIKVGLWIIWTTSEFRRQCLTIWPRMTPAWPLTSMFSTMYNICPSGPSHHVWWLYKPFLLFDL